MLGLGQWPDPADILAGNMCMQQTANMCACVYICMYVIVCGHANYIYVCRRPSIRGNHPLVLGWWLTMFIQFYPTYNNTLTSKLAPRTEVAFYFVCLFVFGDLLCGLGLRCTACGVAQQQAAASSPSGAERGTGEV